MNTRGKITIKVKENLVEMDINSLVSSEDPGMPSLEDSFSQCVLLATKIQKLVKLYRIHQNSHSEVSNQREFWGGNTEITDFWSGALQESWNIAEKKMKLTGRIWSYTCFDVILHFTMLASCFYHHSFSSVMIKLFF